MCASRVSWRKTVAGSHLLANQVGAVQKIQSGFIFNFYTASYFFTSGEARYFTTSDPVANYLVLDVVGFNVFDGLIDFGYVVARIRLNVYGL